MLYAYSDGGATNNNSSSPVNHCGSGAVIIDLEKKKALFMSLYQEKGTNNVGELKAIIEAMSIVAYTRPKGTELTVFTDSAYCITGNNNVLSWKNKEWKNSGGPVKNKRMWEIFLKLKEEVDLTMIKVKGHSGNRYNEVADSLVEQARKTHRNDIVVKEMSDVDVQQARELVLRDANPFPTR